MGTSRNCLLNTFIKNVQIIGACNWSYKRKWNRKLNTKWENKYKQRNVDSWVECENSSVLEWTWLLHLPKGIRTIFKLHYWTKILIIYKKVYSGPFGDCFKCLFKWNLGGESGYVSHLSQISNTTVSFCSHPNDLRDICGQLKSACM